MKMKLKKMLATLGISGAIVAFGGSATVYAGFPGDHYLGDKINNELMALGRSLNHDEIAFGNIPKNFTLGNESRRILGRVKPFAKENGDMVLSKGDTRAAHISYLNNDTGTDQALKTSSFEYTQTNTVTTSATQASGVAAASELKMSFPFVAEAKISMTVKYDFSTTKSVQTSMSQKWSVPVQDIKVPAGRRYKVQWVLNTGVATGTTALRGEVYNCNVPLKRNPRTGLWTIWNLRDSIKRQQQFKNYGLPMYGRWDYSDKWEVRDDGAVIRDFGTSTYRAEIGTELIMTVTDVTKIRGRSLPVEVQRIPMNIMPETIG